MELSMEFPADGNGTDTTFPVASRVRSLGV